MDLTLSEKQILLLYKELFNKYYQPFENEDEHDKIQSAVYVCREMRLPMYNDYGFTWNFEGPRSIILEKVLKDMDPKQKQIEDFLLKPDLECKDLWHEAHLMLIMTFGFIIQSQDYPYFVNIMSNLLYMNTTYGLTSLDRAIRELKRREEATKRDLKVDNMDLLQDAWTSLGLLDLVKVKDDSEFKVLNNLLRRTLSKHRQ